MAVIVREKVSNRLLPIAIMAHNEEKVIQKAVENVLIQKTPIGYSVKVVVVTNGCTDRTEEIVMGLEKENPNRVVLVSMTEKGKPRAINRAIKFFDEISNNDLPIPYVIFLDADCEFLGKEVLINFINRFERDPRLCAVGADCLPDVFFNSRKDIVAEIYRAIYGFGKSVRINSISGMCYGIRRDVLKKIEFPLFQFAEDMFVSARLDGWFFKDRNIQIVFKTPSNLSDEIKRRTRQEISTQRYYEYYSKLKRKRGTVKLFEGSLGEDFRWWGATDNNMVKKWLVTEGLKSKLFSMIYVFIILWAKFKAQKKLRKIEKDSDGDYWMVSR